MFQLDPLHAITACPRWTKNSTGYGNIGVVTKAKILRPKAKRKSSTIIEPVKRWSIQLLADEVKINRDTLVSISRKVIGKGGFLTSDEYDRLKCHLSGIKIRRRMRRK
jgi:hypothetical protein